MKLRTAVKKLMPKEVFEAAAPWWHLAEAVVYNCLYGFPGRNMKVIGVTGTNGKTTTTFLIHRMLTEAGYSAGLMSTVAYGVGADIRPQIYHMTNVPVRELMRQLKQMKADGAEWLVLETTSHALVQHRTWGVPYSVAVLTNITQDHLDYHKTFERYVAAKQRLFKLAQKNKRGLQMGIANADDRNGASFAAETRNSMLYGIQAGEVQATNIKLTADGISYDAKAYRETYHITSRLPGSFNVYNTLAAVCVGRAVGLSQEQIEQGIAALPGVAGRMERVEAAQAFGVVIDYAHTPDALENALSALKEATEGKLSVVFGATGDRDKTKRPIMGEVAARLADRIFLTDDETYTEDGASIRQAVYEGIQAAGGAEKTTVLADRQAAIDAACAAAQPGDMVLLAGIGHQDFRVMAGKMEPWSEHEAVQKALRAL